MAKFSEVADALRHGWSWLYALEVEGCHLIFCEADVGASDPAGLQQSATLKIDKSAAVGSRIDREKGIGVGFDLTVTIMRSEDTETIFKKPTKIARLASDLTHTATTVQVEDATGWTTSDQVFIGTELLGTPVAVDTSSTPHELQNLLRHGPLGTFEHWGKWPAYKVDKRSAVATWVTNSPLYWRGRMVRMWLVPVDQFGAATGSHLLDNASLAWAGHISTDIVPAPDGWTFAAKSDDRRLEESLAASISGKGKIEPNSDPFLTEYPFGAGAAFAMTITQKEEDTYAVYDEGPPVVLGNVVTGSTLDGPHTLEPFESLSIPAGGLPLSSFMAAIVDEWDTTFASSNHYGVSRWKRTIEGSAAVPQITYRLQALAKWSATAANGDHFVVDYGTGTGVSTSTQLAWHASTTIYQQMPQYISDEEWVDLGLSIHLTPTSMGIRVTSDTGDIADIPTAGWVRVELGDRDFLTRYTATTTPGEALLTFNPATGPAPTALSASVTDEEPTEVSVEFLGLVSGSYPDMMRKVITSSGRGNNGAYDTLTHGYDLPDLDASTFDEVMDDGWNHLVGDVAIEARTSFVDLFGGLMRLGRVAVVPRTSDTGQAIKLSAVRTDVYDSPDYNATVEDYHLIRSGGASPVRQLNRRLDPNHWTIEFERGEDKQRLIVRDIVAARAEGVNAGRVTAHGLRKEDADLTLAAWARSSFADRHGMLAYELDVAPWLDIQTGDLINLNLTHWALWNRATGAQGYAGLARVIGRRVALATGSCTLTVLIHGTFKTATLAPSMPVTAFTGSATDPATVTVDQKFVAVVNAYLTAASPVRLYAYRPGFEYNYATTLYAYDVTEISAAGVMTVSATVGSFSLSSDYHLTIPPEAQGNTAQALHTHTDDGTVWR